MILLLSLCAALARASIFPYALPPLPFKKGALEPAMSAKTVDIHYEKHHRGYVTKMNALMMDAETKAHEMFKDVKSFDAFIEELKEADDMWPDVIKAKNLAFQVYNHNLFWANLMPPKEDNQPSPQVMARMKHNFASYKDFRKQFDHLAMDHFGSGWMFLCVNKYGQIAYMPGHNAKLPGEGFVPILAMDLWEHAYFLDYQNDKASYIENFWKMVNWKNVEKMMEAVITEDHTQTA